MWRLSEYYIQSHTNIIQFETDDLRIELKKKTFLIPRPITFSDSSKIDDGAAR